MQTSQLYKILLIGLLVTASNSLLAVDKVIDGGTGSYISHVVVKKLSTGEFLTIIQNVSLSNVDDNDFSAI